MRMNLTGSFEVHVIAEQEDFQSNPKIFFTETPQRKRFSPFDSIIYEQKALRLLESRFTSAVENHHKVLFRKSRMKENFPQWDIFVFCGFNINLLKVFLVSSCYVHFELFMPFSTRCCEYKEEKLLVSRIFLSISIPNTKSTKKTCKIYFPHFLLYFRHLEIML